MVADLGLFGMASNPALDLSAETKKRFKMGSISWLLNTCWVDHLSPSKGEKHYTLHTHRVLILKCTSSFSKKAFVLMFISTVEGVRQME